uniref:Uncharacterized protein n=1 Tax=Anguilla anguilla TaxID=7936 RepID=A0A0E9PXY6_ANGAN
MNKKAKQFSCYHVVMSHHHLGF